MACVGIKSTFFASAEHTDMPKTVFKGNSPKPWNEEMKFNNT